MLNALKKNWVTFQTLQMKNQKEAETMDDFNREVKKHYDEMTVKEKQLKTQLADIGKKIKSLRLYLIEAGMIEKKIKNQRPKITA